MRLADAPALTVATWRLAIAAAVAAPAAALRSRGAWRALDRATRARLTLSGVCLGLHFAFWISSLDHTSVASSVLFVTTGPIWTGLAGHALLGERLRATQLAGIAAAIAGAGLIGGADVAVGGRALVGDALALAGAWAVSAHYLLGRVVRRRLGFLPYVGAIYPIAAATVLALALATGAPLFALSARGAASVVALAVGPQLVGHTAFNWALGHLTATTVTVTILMEPVGAMLLAAAVLREAPTWTQAGGGALLLAGVAVAARRARGAERRRRPPR